MNKKGQDFGFVIIAIVAFGIFVCILFSLLNYFTMPKQATEWCNYCGYRNATDYEPYNLYNPMDSSPIKLIECDKQAIITIFPDFDKDKWGNLIDNGKKDIKCYNIRDN